MSDQELLEQIYFLINENIPFQRHPDPAAQALLATFTPEQEKLFDAYFLENSSHETDERIRLFRRLIRLGLYLQSL